MPNYKSKKHASLLQGSLPLDILIPPVRSSESSCQLCRKQGTPGESAGQVLVTPDLAAVCWVPKNHADPIWVAPLRFWSKIRFNWSVPISTEWVGPFSTHWGIGLRGRTPLRVLQRECCAGGLTQQVNPPDPTTAWFHLQHDAGLARKRESKKFKVGRLQRTQGPTVWTIWVCLKGWTPQMASVLVLVSLQQDEVPAQVTRVLGC